MRTEPGLRTRLWLGGLAGGGVFLTHLIAYRVVSGHAGDRHALTASTGHQYWPFAAALLLAAFVAGLVTFAVGRYTSTRAEVMGWRRFGVVAGRIFLLQLVGFLGLEAAERQFLAHGAGRLFAEPVVLLGVAIQALVALAAALLLLLVARVVDVVASFLQRRLRAPRVLTVQAAGRGWLPRPAVATTGITLRGPPPILRSTI